LTFWSLAKTTGYSLAKGILRYKARFDGLPKILVPQFLISSLFASFHVSPVGGGHLGIRKTLYTIRQTFIWFTRSLGCVRLVYVRLMYLMVRGLVMGDTPR
jgi:hypothetical protein